jgi:PmbA protein
VRCFDAEVEQLDASTLITLGEEIVDRLRAYDPELQIDISLDRRVENVSLMNTSGLEIKDRRTLFTVSVEVTRTREGDILILYGDARSRQKGSIDGQSVAEHLVEKLRWTEKAASVRSGAMPVVFAGMATLCLALPLTYGLNGRYVYLGASPLGERIGQQVFDPRFSFVDDGRLDFAARSTTYDDEGTPTSRHELIERGVVNQFLYDLKTAGQAGAQPTGNGFKSDGMLKQGFELPPNVVPTTGWVSAGAQSLEQILGGLDEALLVYEVIGLGQGNVLAGEFSNNVSLGFLVRRGEIVGRVKNTMIAGNIYDLLSDQLIGLSDRAEWVYGMLHTPAIAIDGVGVASQG